MPLQGRIDPVTNDVVNGAAAAAGLSDGRFAS
jgi:hypothetical protein